jgi:hypothetical protein
MSSFDVWLITFEPGEIAPSTRLQDAFGMDPASARELEQALPRVVKHGLAADAAEEMREALEAIGGVVDCRASMDADEAVKANRTAVFHPPGADMFPGRSISNIDPLKRISEGGTLRLSLGDLALPQPAPVPEVPVPARVPEAPSEPSSSRAVSGFEKMREILRVLQPPKTVPWSTATVAVGVAVLTMSGFLGGSIFRGEANWFGIGVAGLGIYLLGVGALNLFTLWRSS